MLAWPGIGDRLMAGQWRAPCDPVFDDLCASELRRAIEVLGSTGAEVVVADSPYLWLPVAPDADERVACLNEVYHREVDALGATLMPLLEWTCADGPEACIDEVDGVKLRADGIHFRDEGAEIAASWAAPFLRERALRSADAEQQQGAEEPERGD